LRSFIEALKGQGELAEIDAEVDWNIELGTIMRLAQGPGTGKAVIFNNIKDYNTPTARCRRIFGSSLNSYRRIALMLGLPPDTHPRELVKIGRTILTGSIPPRIVATGPVKENILTGEDIDL
jgi:4-hydroxy-3-polyprenylbenzoate decarboxylase